MKVKGFKAAAAAAGMKYKDRMDVGLIVAETPAAAAGVFTRNLVAAAPVVWCREKLKDGKASAILVNAGQANACTGEPGLADAAQSAMAAAQALGVRADDVLLASTGVIGMRLNMDALTRAVPRMAGELDENGLDRVARAMMTTDTRPKTAEATGEIAGRPFTVAGMAKGSGMIMPNMATMLSFILTDAAVHPEYLQAALSRTVDRTFNVVTVDGDTSTNDCVMVLAGGGAGNTELTGPQDEGAAAFEQALLSVARDLAKMVAFDGEGATKAVTIDLQGARDDREAHLAAMTVANSPLVKTALFGQDANWGRLMMALGRSGAWFDPSKVRISVGDQPLVKNGVDAGNEKAATAVMKQKEFTIRIDLGAGPGRIEVYTCDFSYDYVKINADYRS